MNAPIPVQPRRSPEPGRPFVNRGRELELIRKRLDIGIRGEPMKLVVACFWGALGMGKSWLLLELESRHIRGGPQARGSHPTVTARLDLSPNTLPSLWHNDRLDREHLIRELWKQLATQLGNAAPEVGRASADDWAELFVEQVTAWSSQSVTPVIMLDTVDALIARDEKTLFWLEKHIVERLAMTERVLFVLASRGEVVQWKSWQVRRRVDSHRLLAFDAKTAGQEVKAGPDVTEALYLHAFGHPLVTDLLGTVLEEQGADLKTGEATLPISTDLVRTILVDVTRQLLEQVPEPVRELARIASVLRWVSVEPLRFLTESMGLARPELGDAYYLARIDDLQAHHLLYWNSVKNSYEPDPVLRRLLAHLLELDDVAQFRAAHLAASAFHEDHLSRLPQYLARYLPEFAYHSAMAARYESLGVQPPKLQAWWQRFLAGDIPTHPEPWRELANALEQDLELRDVLPAEDYEALCSEANRRAN